MSRAAPALLALILTVPLPGGAVASPEARGRWRGPLPGGRVVGPFTYDRASPFARGARRGIDLRGAPGSPVLAACAGTVVFAGAVPSSQRGVTIACDGRELRATELGLAAITVRRGTRVRAGTPLGRLAAPGVLRLGARRADDPRGYVDPEALLIVDRGPSTAPPARSPHERRPPRLPPAPSRRAPATPTTARLPWPAYAGLALLAASAAGGAGTARRRRRVRARMQPAHRYR